MSLCCRTSVPEPSGGRQGMRRTNVMSGGTMRETNNPDLLLVAARSILSPDECLERRRGECGCIQQHFADKIPAEFKLRVQTETVSIANPGNHLSMSLVPTVTYRKYYRKVSMRCCPSFWNMSWIMMNGCTDIKDMVDVKGKMFCYLKFCLTQTE